MTMPHTYDRPFGIIQLSQLRYGVMELVFKLDETPVGYKGFPQYRLLEGKYCDRIEASAAAATATVRLLTDRLGATPASNGDLLRVRSIALQEAVTEYAHIAASDALREAQILIECTASMLGVLDEMTRVATTTQEQTNG